VCRVALPPAKQEVVASHASLHDAHIEDCSILTVSHALPSPEVMPHETSLFSRHHALALHFVPRSSQRPTSCEHSNTTAERVLRVAKPLRHQSDRRAIFLR
jgi:hypothetical protein